MVDTNGTTVYRVRHTESGTSAHYHRTPDCSHLANSAVRETTERKARARGYQPCGDCVGRRCPLCGSRTTDRLYEHLPECRD